MLNKPLYIFTIRASNPDGDKKKMSFLTTDEINAKLHFIKFYSNKSTVRWSLTASLPTCNNKLITELHCLKYGTKFQAVHKGSINRSFECDEHSVKSPLLTKYDYNPINRTYLCIDGEGNKHYIDAYEWCITEEEVK